MMQGPSRRHGDAGSGSRLNVIGPTCGSSRAYGGIRALARAANSGKLRKGARETARPARDNKPLPEEIANCRPFLEAQIDSLVNARVYVALGQIAHQSAVRTLGGKLAVGKVLVRQVFKFIL